MPDRHLKQELKLRNLFTLAFGSIIGVGWITVLGSWLSQAGSTGTIIAFLAGGLVILVIGLCYAEAATLYPVSGGEVAYLYEMYGTRVSFLAGWFLALNYVGLTAFEAISVGWILSALFPGLEGPVIYNLLGTDVRLAALLIGLLIMAIITFVNYRGARSTARFQDTMTYTLLLISCLFIGAGLLWGDPANLQPHFARSEDSTGSYLLGIMAVFATTPFWFAGFDTIPQAMGEKSRTESLHLLPWVISLAIGLSLVFYCLVVVASAMAVPREQLLAIELPAAGAMEAAFNSPALGKTVLLAGLCGLITTWNAMFFAGSRLIFALGRARMIPPSYGAIHQRYGSPKRAVLFVGLVGAALSLLGKSAVLPIVNVGATAMSLVFLLVSTGILRLRLISPNLERPYRAPGGIWLPGVAALLCLLMLGTALYEPYSAGDGSVPVEWWLLLAWSGAGLLFWRLAKDSRNAIDETQRREMLLH